MSKETLELFSRVELTNDNNVPHLVRAYHKLLNEKIELIDLHFRYLPTSDGSKLAKEDFLNKIRLHFSTF